MTKIGIFCLAWNALSRSDSGQPLPMCFIEHDAGSDRNVQRIKVAGHGYFDEAIGFAQNALADPLVFGPHDEGDRPLELFFVNKPVAFERGGIDPEAVEVQGFYSLFQRSDPANR